MSNETPTSIIEHFDLFWKVLVATIVALYLLSKMVFHGFKKRFDSMEKDVKRLIELIPIKAFQEGALLVTSQDCNALRAHCTNITVINELSDSMRVIKRAIVVLVLHSDTIPKDEREKIAKELIQ